MSHEEKNELADLFRELMTEQNKKIESLQNQLEWVGHLTWFGKVVLIMLGVFGSIIGIIKGLRSI